MGITSRSFTGCSLETSLADDDIINQFVFRRGLPGSLDYLKRIATIATFCLGRNVSDAFLPPLAGKNAMELYRQHCKKNIIAGTSGESPKEVEEVISLPTTPSVGMLKKKKHNDAFDLMGLSDSINLSFHSSAAAHSECAPHLGEVEKLLFVEDNDHLEAMRDVSFGAAVRNMPSNATQRMRE
ncbi:hypothetical protein OROHE_002904 [Orobanche hederae]